jgi:selenocysteine lyase/cysteine desulfurase
MLCERLPPAVIGWRSDRNWRSVADLNHGAPQFVNSAEKYEGGMLAFAPLYGMAESISLFLEIGPSRIEARVLDLAGKVSRMLELAGATVAFAGSPIVAARFPNQSAEALAEELKKHRVLVAARHGYLRVSPHLYNSEEDLEQLQAVLG